MSGTLKGRCTENIWDIERHIIPVEEGMKIANETAIKAFKDSSSDGTPTAFAFYKNKLYVIWTAGQGPGFAYAPEWYE